MSLSEKLLEYFSESTEFVSGEELAKMNNVSRNAVWKAVKQLKSSGYDIISEKSGYRLSESNSRPLLCELRRKTNCENIIMLDLTESTNDYAKSLALNGAEEKTAVFALGQSKGKGRLGRSFVSNKGGLYFSVVLRPRLSADEIMLITVAAAVAVCKALRNAVNKDFLIKWVNDIYLSDKKVCGILTEGSFNAETASLEYAVLGIGVNLASVEEKLPDELKQTVGSVFENENVSSKIYSDIASDIYNGFFKYYSNIKDRSFMEYYKSHSYLDGKTVSFLKDGKPHTALVLGITDNAGIILKEGNTETVLNAGEVSVKPI